MLNPPTHPADRSRRQTASSAFRAAAIGVALSLVWATPGLTEEEPDPETRMRVNTGVLSPTFGTRGSGVFGQSLDVRARSWSEIKWANVIRQRTHIGCGPAALATILTYYFDFPTSEIEMVNALYAEAIHDYRDAGASPPGDVNQIGFNLRHIRNVARKGGLVAASFRVDLESIEQVEIPVITRVTIKGYDHFAVFKGARGGRVFLADPAFGNTSYRLDQFDRIWSGVMMGFVRRDESLPEDHLLEVELEDQREISWHDVMRIASRDPFDFRFDQGVVGGAFIPNSPIPGLESVLPRRIVGFQTFGEDITF